MVEEYSACSCGRKFADNRTFSLAYPLGMSRSTVADMGVYGLPLHAKAEISDRRVGTPPHRTNKHTSQPAAINCNLLAHKPTHAYSIVRMYDKGSPRRL